MRVTDLPTADELSPGLRALLCNGIGPRAGSSWLSQVACTGILFVSTVVGLRALYDDAGDDHDLHYAMGGTETDRILADAIFVANLTEINRAWPWLLRALGHLLTFLCFTAVRIGGDFGSFRRRVRRVSIEELEKEYNL